jgi:hypothetical protein
MYNGQPANQQHHPQNRNPISPSSKNIPIHQVPIAVIERLQNMDDFCSRGIKNYINKASRALCDSVEALVALNETLSYCGESEQANKANQIALDSILN